MSKFSDEERARIIAEANYYTRKGPRPPSLDPKPEPKTVHKEARREDLIYKTREVETAPVAATSDDWEASVLATIERSFEPGLHDAIGTILADERQRERDEIKTAIDRLDRELGKTIAVNQGKGEGRAHALENRLEREVREMQQRVDRAESAMNDARQELLRLASEFRAILDDAAEAQRQISLALLHR